jgi:hypothetical protein
VSAGSLSIDRVSKVDVATSRDIEDVRRVNHLRGSKTLFANVMAFDSDGRGMQKAFLISRLRLEKSFSRVQLSGRESSRVIQESSSDYSSKPQWNCTHKIGLFWNFHKKFLRKQASGAVL